MNDDYLLSRYEIQNGCCVGLQLKQLVASRKKSKFNKLPKKVPVDIFARTIVNYQPLPDEDYTIRSCEHTHKRNEKSDLKRIEWPLCYEYSDGSLQMKRFGKRKSNNDCSTNSKRKPSQVNVTNESVRSNVDSAEIKLTEQHPETAGNEQLNPKKINDHSDTVSHGKNDEFAKKMVCS